jgi:hypothetical protein
MQLVSSSENAAYSLYEVSWKEKEEKGEEKFTAVVDDLRTFYVPLLELPAPFPSPKS